METPGLGQDVSKSENAIATSSELARIAMILLARI
jgi:hypothetical protein